MLFNSFEYLYLVLGSFLAYWVMPTVNLRMLVLLVASAVFYISWSVTYYILLVLVLVLVWFLSLFYLSRSNKSALIVSIVSLLGLLSYFKYTNFFIDNLNFITSGEGFSSLQIILPLGISFYIFQLMAYCVDVYKGKVKPEKNIIKFITFVSFYPQLIAGPICRAVELLPQMVAKQKISLGQCFDGVVISLCGLCLKVAIADRIAPYVNVVFDTPQSYSGFDNLLVVVGFGVQILCDFWGYSLIAVGTAMLFGLRLPHNFNLPYASLSISKFWQRWHITLGSWLRDYLYIPLGGNRGGAFFTSRNLLITMLVGGFWHGASWNFILWGGIHGLALIVNRYYSEIPLLKMFVPIMRIKLFSWVATMCVVFSAWVFFRAASLGDALMVFEVIFDFGPYWLSSSLPVEFFEVLVIFLPLHYLVHYMTHAVHGQLWGRRLAPIFVPLLALISIVYFQDSGEFIYFQF